MIWKRGSAEGSSDNISSKRPSRGVSPTVSEKETPMAIWGADSFLGVQESKRMKATAAERKDRMGVKF